MTILLGWDVAQTTDSSIIAVVAYDGNPAMYWVRRIVKLPKGMSYDKQVTAVRELYFQYQSPKLIIDRTGVGLPICDMIVAGGLQPVQVSLTSGDVVSKPEPGKVNLPKKDMVASITKAIQERRLKVVVGCENAALFRTELKNFQLKVSASGHNSYNAASGQHDDTITAIGLCLWYGDKGIGHHRPFRIASYKSGKLCGVFDSTKGRDTGASQVLDPVEPVMITEVKMTAWNDKTQDERRAEVRQLLLTHAASKGEPSPTEEALNAAVDSILNNASSFQMVDISSRSEK